MELRLEQIVSQEEFDLRETQRIAELTGPYRTNKAKDYVDQYAQKDGTPNPEKLLAPSEESFLSGKLKYLHKVILNSTQVETSAIAEFYKKAIELVKAELGETQTLLCSAEYTQLSDFVNAMQKDLEHLNNYMQSTDPESVDPTKCRQSFNRYQSITAGYHHIGKNPEYLTELFAEMRAQKELWPKDILAKEKGLE